MSHDRPGAKDPTQGPGGLSNGLAPGPACEPV
jgi:hypothetical protein